MTEEFLHYVWQYRLYSTRLILQNDEDVQVLHPGTYNTDSGPDFFNARIRIGTTTWVGNIEIHIRSSDWLKHGHQDDRAYDSVVLHVVFIFDQLISRPDGTPIPTLELQNQMDISVWKRYLRFMSSRSWISCESQVASVDPVILSTWIPGLTVERLVRKAAHVERALSFTLNDWNLAFYFLLARNMGFKLNNDAFETLAYSLPYNHLARNSDNLFQLEAMIFGQAGMLGGSFRDSYPNQLKKEYLYLKNKLSLSPMDEHQWKFMRLHPGNFPTLRLSQFAAIIHKSQGLLIEMIEINDLGTYHKVFNVEASEYWKTHYRFDKNARPGSRRMGAESVNALIINLISPFLFAYGRIRGDSSFIEKALEILERVKGENNTITRKWKEFNMPVGSASSTQALMELKSNYCDQKKCLSCRIGNALLKGI